MIDFMEVLVLDQLRPSPPDIVRFKPPVSVSLLESLYLEMISVKKYSHAARVINILAKARLVVDIDTTYVLSDGGVTDSPINDDIGSSPQSMVEAVRVRLARRWAAMLVGKSLNKLKIDVTDSILKVSGRRRGSAL